MKVKELIHILASAPKNSEVVFDTGEGLAGITQVDILDRYEDDNTHIIDVRLRE